MFSYNEYSIFFIVIMEKIKNADEQILSEEQKQRIFIDFLN